MALAANRENMWVSINTRLVKEIEELREVGFVFVHTRALASALLTDHCTETAPQLLTPTLTKV
jgi:hypothetical protein